MNRGFYAPWTWTFGLSKQWQLSTGFSNGLIVGMGLQYTVHSSILPIPEFVPILGYQHVVFWKCSSLSSIWIQLICMAVAQQRIFAGPWTVAESLCEVKWFDINSPVVMTHPSNLMTSLF